MRLGDHQTDGQLERAGDRWQLRFVRILPHPPEKVWRALTEPAHLSTWFPTDIEGDRAMGAALVFRFRNGEGPPIDGQIMTYNPPTLLEFRWGDDETLRFELARDGDGTILTFVNTFDQLGKAARDAAGWHACLDLLGNRLDGTAAPSASRERWQRLHDTYVERFGSEASTIGPPAARPEAS